MIPCKKDSDGYWALSLNELVSMALEECDRPLSRARSETRVVSDYLGTRWKHDHRTGFDARVPTYRDRKVYEAKGIRFAIDPTFEQLVRRLAASAGRQIVRVCLLNVGDFWVKTRRARVSPRQVLDKLSEEGYEGVPFIVGAALLAAQCILCDQHQPDDVYRLLKILPLTSMVEGRTVVLQPGFFPEYQLGLMGNDPMYFDSKWCVAVLHPDDVWIAKPLIDAEKETFANDHT